MIAQKSYNFPIALVGFLLFLALTLTLLISSPEQFTQDLSIAYLVLNLFMFGCVVSGYIYDKQNHIVFGETGMVIIRKGKTKNIPWCDVLYACTSPIFNHRQLCVFYQYTQEDGVKSSDMIRIHFTRQKMDYLKSYVPVRNNHNW